MNMMDMNYYGNNNTSHNNIGGNVNGNVMDMTNFGVNGGHGDCSQNHLDGAQNISPTMGAFAVPEMGNDEDVENQSLQFEYSPNGICFDELEKENPDLILPICSNSKSDNGLPNIMSNEVSNCKQSVANNNINLIDFSNCVNNGISGDINISIPNTGTKIKNELGAIGGNQMEIGLENMKNGQSDVKNESDDHEQQNFNDKNFDNGNGGNDKNDC